MAKRRLLIEAAAAAEVCLALAAPSLFSGGAPSCFAGPVPLGSTSIWQHCRSASAHFAQGRATSPLAPGFADFPPRVALLTGHAFVLAARYLFSGKSQQFADSRLQAFSLTLDRGRWIKTEVVP